MRVARAVQNLIEAFERLPGVGPKSAQRLTYYLLHVPQGELDKLGNAVMDLKKNTKMCSICFNISETDPCDICSDTHRDESIAAVVEQPLDILALERGNTYNGVYHVLHGVIDPLHNIGPEEIRIGELISRLKHITPLSPLNLKGDDPKGRGDIKELILALNPNMEGEATCLYIKKAIEEEGINVKVTRLAHGLPVGADIEYADDITLNRAMEGRREY